MSLARKEKGPAVSATSAGWAGGASPAFSLDSEGIKRARRRLHAWRVARDARPSQSLSPTTFAPGGTSPGNGRR